MFSLLKGKSELFLVCAVVCILMMLFVPVPAVLLDILLILNFSFALLILLLTFYSEKPLSFSTFPSLLLIATLFRLGLNVSATRLILNEGEAGVVISSIGSYAVGGNYIVGLVVFFILVVIQYVVVTNGAQRVAEVAARFTLDSMPGKQMSIDADLNMGLIDEIKAKDRRKEVEREASFYGAMDGATKFVKGDAIAGIIIIIIDIVGGLAIGVAQVGLSWNEALQKYTLLTVGDGIVTQIPSLVIATATGIIITRAASDAKLGEEITKQALSSPQTLMIVGIALLSTLAIPEFPKIPIFLLASAFLYLSYISNKKRLELLNASNSESQELDTGTEINENVDSTVNSPIQLVLSVELKQELEEKGNLLSERLIGFRQNFVKSSGYLIPNISLISDPLFKANYYQINLFGARIASGVLYLSKYLVIDPKGKFTAVTGIEGKEPAYRLPACWVDEEQLPAARSAGYTVVDPETTVLTHISEILKNSVSELLTRAETEQMVLALGKTKASLIDELVPDLMSYSEIQMVLKNLLKEKVPIHNLELILETLLDSASKNKDSMYLTQQVRIRLKSQICNEFVDDVGTLNVITLASSLEQKLIKGISLDGDKTNIAIEPMLLDNLLGQLTRQTESFLVNKLTPVLITNSSLRFALKQLLDRVIPQLNILSIDEIPSYTNVKASATITDNSTKKVEA